MDEKAEKAVERIEGVIRVYEATISAQEAKIENLELALKEFERIARSRPEYTPFLEQFAQLADHANRAQADRDPQFWLRQLMVQVGELANHHLLGEDRVGSRIEECLLNTGGIVLHWLRMNDKCKPPQEKR